MKQVTPTGRYSERGKSVIGKVMTFSPDGCVRLLLLYAGCAHHLLAPVSCDTDWRRQISHRAYNSSHTVHRPPYLQPYRLRPQSYVRIDRWRPQDYHRTNEVEYHATHPAFESPRDGPLLVGHSHNPYGNSIENEEAKEPLRPASRGSTTARPDDGGSDCGGGDASGGGGDGSAGDASDGGGGDASDGGGGDASDGSGGETRGKRGVVHLYNMISCATGCDPISYKGYGCYCGFLGSGRALDGIDRCCKIHDRCYEDLFCPIFTVYLQPYYWTCHRGEPLCALENHRTKNQLINGCAASLCECDRQLAMCLRRYPCPRRRAICRSSPLRLLQNLLMAR